MTIVLYQISDDRRQLSKTLDVSTKLREVTGELKSDCSVMDPIIELTYDATLLHANYLYISEFGRYYYINNIDVGAQRVYINCHVDVLHTYATEIKKLDCVIARQSDPGKCDLYLTDKAFKAENRHIVSIRKFSGKFDKSNASYILTTGGKS